MPASFLIRCVPTADAPVVHVQAANIQAMFLRRMQAVDAALAARLHDAPGYRPVTLSPLGIVGEPGYFQGFRLPRAHLIPKGRACYIRVTVLDDALISSVLQGFQPRMFPDFILGGTPFAITDASAAGHFEPHWNISQSYPELINNALAHQRRKTVRLRFLTPTSFRQGKLDLPVPVPRLVFQSFEARFEQFYQVEFLPNFADTIEQYVGIAAMRQVNSAGIHTKHVRSVGFTGDVTFALRPKAPPELRFQVNLLAAYALFCGTGKKTLLGMGQTIVN